MTEEKETVESILRRANSGRRGKSRITEKEVPSLGECIDTRILQSIIGNAQKGCNGLEMSHWHGLVPNPNPGFDIPYIKTDETNWCQTTHCRAGYAISLAGKAGYDLERRINNAEVAGQLIYVKSRGSYPSFHVNNASAILDLMDCARSQDGFEPSKEDLELLINKYGIPRWEVTLRESGSTITMTVLGVLIEDVVKRIQSASWYWDQDIVAVKKL